MSLWNQCINNNRRLFDDMMKDATSEPLWELQEKDKAQESKDLDCILKGLLGDAAVHVHSFTKKLLEYEGYEELLHLADAAKDTGSMWGWFVHSQVNNGWDYNDPIETAKIIKHTVWTVAFPKQNDRWKRHVLGIFARALGRTPTEMENVYKSGVFIINPYKKQKHN